MDVCDVNVHKIQAGAMHPGSAGAPRSYIEMLAWIAACAALILLRLPSVLPGRFWAEDGQLFYTQAWALPWAQAVFSVANGYMNLVGNVAGLLARDLVPIEFAPIVTTGVALLIQLLPCTLLITSEERWLSRRIVLALALLVIIIPPSAEEVWLNTANSQFHMLLASALVVALDARVGLAGLLNCCILFFAPLCGPGPVTLIPLCFARVWREASAARWMQAAALSAGVGVQFLFFLQYPSGRGLHTGVGPLIGAIYVKQLLVPLLGRFSAGPAQQVALAIRHGLTPLRAEAGVVALLFVYASIAYNYAVKSTRFMTPAWLVEAACLVLVASYVGAIGGPATLIDMIGGERYSFAPQALFTLALLAAATHEFSYRNILPLVLLICMLVIGIVGIGLSPLQIFASGPDWRREVDAWRIDPAYQMRIWPDGWVVRIPAPSDFHPPPLAGAASSQLHR